MSFMGLACISKKTKALLETGVDRCVEAIVKGGFFSALSAGQISIFEQQGHVIVNVQREPRKMKDLLYVYITIINITKTIACVDAP